MVLQQLRYFQQVSRLRNITKAAEKFQVSQPNITVSIRKLEHELGIQLFDRSQKQLALTPEGTVFLNRIELALRNIDDAILEVNDYKKLQKGTIKIGVPPMMGAFVFPKIFSEFQKTHPHLDIFLYEEGSMAIREKIEEGELDFGVIIISEAAPSLELLAITRNQLLACVPSKHPLAKKKAVGYRDISDLPLILFKPGSYLRQLLLRDIAQSGITPNIVMESNQLSTIKGLVTREVGISFLLDLVIDNHPGITALPLREPIFVDVGLAWKKERYISKAAQSFIDFCQDTLREHESPGI